jgi:hypothetical protein
LGLVRSSSCSAQACWISSSDFPFVSGTLALIHTKATTNLDTVRTPSRPAADSPIAPTANSTPAISRVRVRPNRSAKPQPSNAPTSAPRVTRLVMTSCTTVPRSKLSVIPASAPAMTPWS